MAEIFPSTTTIDPGDKEPSFVALLVIGLLCSVLLLLPVKVTALSIFVLGCVLLAVYLMLSALQGNLAPFLLIWIVIFPLGYYFLSFPKERPWFTFDRAVVGLLLMGAITTASPKATPITREMRAAGVAWLLFLLLAALSLAQGRDLLSAAHVLIDAFLLPALLGFYVLRSFPVQRYLKQIHVLVSLMAIYLAVLGFIEVYTGVDLFPVQEGANYFAGSGNSELLRVSGPFTSNNSYGLIGLITFFLLLFLKKAMDQALPLWVRCLHVAAIVCALAVALMPLFRSIALTLLIVFLMEVLQVRRRALGLALLALVALLAGGFFWLSAQFPDLYEERVSGMDNLYARLAQNQQSLELFLSHPLVGVGLNGFHAATETDTKYVTQFNGVDALDYPHSNLLAVLAETGILGFAAYLSSQVLLVYAFLRVRRKGTLTARRAWKYFLWVFLAYWVSGLSLTSGYYSDLNLWFVFAVALLYKYSSHGDRVSANR